MIKKVILSFLLCGLFFQTQGTHIVGGDFTYRWISGNTFELSLVLFRDCNSATQFDNHITIGIFDRVTNLFADSLPMTLNSTGSLQLAGSLCSPPPQICVETGTYIKNINLPDNPNGYYLSWERCCRNHTVLNINNPGATGMVFYMEMPDPSLHNSSPVFLNDPLPYMCESQPFAYNFGGYDPDGDSLAYELVSPSAGNSSQAFPTLPAPIAGPYTDVIFQAPYSLSNVCGGTPLAIDPVSGDITAIPNYFGIYAMAELVKEYRNGIQIGCIRREIEFTVIICDGNLTPQVISYSTGQQPNTHHFEIYETDSLCFSINGHDDTDSLFITYLGNCFAGSGINPPYAVSSNSAGFMNVSTSFCWYTGCGQGRDSLYNVDYTVKDNGCPLSIAAQYKITIQVKPIPLIAPLNLLCASFEGDQTVHLFWDVLGPNDPFLTYFLIYRNMNSGPFAAIDTIYDKQPGIYTDTEAYDFKNNNYCYYIRGFNICDNGGVTSDTLCSNDAVNEKANYIESVSVKAKNIIELKIEEFPDASMRNFYIYRKDGHQNSFGNFSLYKTLHGLNSFTWSDTDVKTSERSYCYYVINEDPCGNMSPPSDEACSILLTGTSVPYTNSIHWSEYINWRGGVFDYEIYRRTSDLLDFSKLTNVEYLVFDLDDEALDYNSGRYFYQVKATEGAGSKNAESYSNEVELDQPPLVFTPNAFTPNNDNSNDAWGVSTIFIKEYTLRIFNRYGELVYLSTDKKQAWDGTFHGKAAPQGVYVYDLRYNSYYNENESRKSGTITLLR